MSFEKSQITNVDMTSTTFAGGNLSEIVLDGVKLVKTNFQGFGFCQHILLHVCFGISYSLKEIWFSV